MKPLSYLVLFLLLTLLGCAKSKPLTVGFSGSTDDFPSAIPTPTPSPSSTNSGPNILPVISVQIFAGGMIGNLAVPYGGQTQISWSSIGATNCTVIKPDGSVFGTGMSSAGISTGTLTSTIFYTITCVNGDTGGIATDSVAVDVGPAPVISGVLSLNDLLSEDFDYDSTGILRWTTENTTSCTVRAPDGTSLSSALNETVGLTTPLLKSSGEFKLECAGTANVYKVTANVRPKVTVRANGQLGSINVDSGTPVSISWSSDYADSCTLSSSTQPNLIMATSHLGYSVGNATASTLYTVKCTKSAYNNPARQLSTTSDVFINVNSNPAPYVELKVDGVTQKSYPYHYTGAVLSWTSQNALSCKLVSPNNTQLATGLNSNYPIPFLSLNEGSWQYQVVCSAAGFPDARSTVWITVAPPNDHKFFVSKNLYTGNLGGLAGADAKCLAAAQSVGLRVERPWKAVLGSMGTSAKNRITIIGPVKRTDGVKLANDSNGFWSSGSWGVPNPAAPNVGEDMQHPNGSGGGYLPTWSSLNLDGSNRASSSSQNCNDWTSDSAGHTGYIGDANDAGSQRFYDGSTAVKNCNKSFHIYCISQ